MEVIPAINCHFGDSEAVSGKLNEARKFSKWVHLDVADGNFTFNKSWNDPEGWKSFGSGLNLEVHFMLEHPETEVRKWLEAGAKRVIVHFESLSEESGKEIIKMCREVSAGVMLALNPETRIKDMSPFFRNFAEYEILSVHPGLSGQKFLPLVLEKISELRRAGSSARIQVDGGINAETAKLVSERGADSVVAGSYIWKSHSPAGAYKELTNI